MNKRETRLALIVGVLVAAQAIFWIATSVQKSFRTRRATKSQIQQKINAQELKMQRAIAADRDIKEYQSRSLPSNLDLAQTQYETWLAKLLADAEIATTQLKCKKPVRKGTEPVSITWSVGGTGTLEQVTQLLHGYYSLDTLHRMSSLKLISSPDSRALQVKFDTQALVLADTDPENKLDPTRQSAWAQTHRRADVDRIIQRNMLSQANRPPKIVELRAQEVTLGKSLALRIEANDPDTIDRIHFSLVESPVGANVNEVSGEIQWEPTKVGAFQFLVQVADDGIPSRSVTQPFSVKVVPAPPPPPPAPPEPEPPTVDEAMFTYVTGQVRVNGKPQIWLTVRTSGKTLKLGEGDEIQIGSIDGVISKINDRSFELTLGDDRREIRRGDPLVPSPAGDQLDDEVN